MSDAKHRAARVGVSELRNKLERVLSQLKKSPVILERHGKVVAVMIDHGHYEKVEEMFDVAEDLGLSALAAARDRFANEGDFVDIGKW